MNESDRGMPARLGRYEIVERLAAGGMGEVFIARSVGVGGFIKPVAVKRIHPHLAGMDQFIDMLHDEANVSAAIRHPNIIATIDVGVDGDNHFVVLDYVSGDPISRIVKELKRRNLTMPPWVVAWVGAQVASALHAAHEAKNLQGESLEIVHRDVSLGNILLSDEGHPMLFDFGVAKAKRKIHQTAQGEIKGKLPYMAPEMFTGASVSRSVDVFSLGVVLYEMLTSFSPFQRASDVDTIMALRNGNVPPPSQVRPGIDPRLDPIVLNAMASERAKRTTTAAQVEEGLRAWARATGAPHDPAQVAHWLAWAFPERLAQRRALLGRVANAQAPAVGSAPPSLKQSQSFMAPPTSSAYGALVGATTSGTYPAPTGLMTSGNLPRSPSATPTPDPLIAPPDQGLSDGSRARWFLVAASATVVGGMLAFLVVGPGTRHHSTGGEAALSSSAAIIAPSASVVAPTASSAAPLPSASASAAPAVSAKHP